MIPYYHSPFYSSLIIWRKRLRNCMALLIGIMLFHGRVPPPESIPDMWFWTGVVFGIVLLVCYAMVCQYERYIVEACGYLNKNTIIGVTNFKSIHKRHVKWFRREFKSDPDDTNSWKL